MKQIAEQYNQKDIAQRIDKFLGERTGAMK
jgi:hypothetical protein